MKIIHLIFSIALISLVSCKANKEIIEISPPLAPILVPENRPKVDFKLEEVITSSNISGVYKYWPGWKYDPMIASDLPTPKGFEISPANANFIYSFLLGNVPIGLGGVEHMYFDEDSYYVSHLWPAENKFNDAQVMLDMGVRINGKDGTVYNRKTKKWEVRGYIHKNGDKIKKELALGSSPQEVNKKIGKHFLYSDYGSFSNMHYWAKDGEIVLRFEEKKLVRVDTQVKLGRH